MKFKLGLGGYDGKQRSSAVGMSMLAESAAVYEADMELRKRTDGKRGTVSILRVPVEKERVVSNSQEINTSADALAS